MTDSNPNQLHAAYVEALINERRSYATNPDKADRLKDVDAELAKYGVKVDKEGEATLPENLQPEAEAVDAGAVEGSSLETTDGKPAKAPASKPAAPAAKPATAPVKK